LKRPRTYAKYKARLANEPLPPNNNHNVNKKQNKKKQQHQQLQHLKRTTLEKLAMARIFPLFFYDCELLNYILSEQIEKRKALRLLRFQSKRYSVCVSYILAPA